MLVYGADADVCSWVSDNLFGNPDCYDDKCRGIGVSKNNNLIAGIVYKDYQPNLSIEMAIASIDKSWSTRHNIKAFFKYPFIDLGVKRVSTLCSADEGDIIMFNKRLGFKPEGYHRSAWHNGGDAISFGMLKTECRWI